MLLYYSLALALGLASDPVLAQTWPYDLIGTWSTKSNKTLTGPVRPLCTPPTKYTVRTHTHCAGLL